MSGNTLSEKEKRIAMIQEEIDIILKNADAFCLQHLEEEMEEEAIEALKKAAMKLAYTKKYYDVMKDQIVFFPSVSKLILKAELTEEAEKYYFDEGDDWPLEYTKALKTVVREAASSTTTSSDEDMAEVDEENDAYIAKLAIDVEI
eukprot:scaffold770_cov109-Cylindrotheca_fusiformis.AAC.15